MSIGVFPTRSLSLSHAHILSIFFFNRSNNTILETMLGSEELQLITKRMFAVNFQVVAIFVAVAYFNVQCAVRICFI